MLDKNMETLATLIEHCCCEPQYKIPFTHDELIEILLKIKDGHVLTENEYDLIMMLLGSEDNENIGDVLFSGDYIDLINKPFIPSKLEDLRDYSIVMGRINSMFNSLSDKDKEIIESINDIARFMSAIEVTLTSDVERLTKLIEACSLFQGESLEDVITGIQGELGWLDELKEDLIAGKVLSEKDFTAAYEEILKSIIEAEEGLIGYIKEVIKESIKDPGKPNGNGVFTLDTIGEALATKVDKTYLKELIDTYANKYGETLDTIEEKGGLTEYLTFFLDQYTGRFTTILNETTRDLLSTVNMKIEELDKRVEEETIKIEDKVEEVKKETYDGFKFQAGDGPVSINIGGLKKGTILEDKSVRDVLLELICPFVLPSVSAELSLAVPDRLYEIGDVVEIIGIRAIADKGSLPIRQMIFKEKIGNTYKTIGTYLGAEQIYHLFPDVYELTHTINDTYFMVEIEDTEGNTSSCGAGSINFVCPIYYGNGNFKNEDEITEESVLSLYNSKKIHKLLKYMGEECKFEYTTDSEQMLLIIPAEYGPVKHIYDQNNYEITNSFDITPIKMRFYVKEKIGDGYRENEYIKDYYVYHSNFNTVFGFEITFKF